ncbi:MAG: hypothetical protein IPK03_01015 [Bacteroidetes bacterium]|nr:hypothetical protein [Bacteroidota bacterium]
MSNRFLYLLLVLMVSISGFGQIKMGNNPLNINSKSLLELEDTTRGFVLPRMNTANMNSINTGLVGMLIYNTDQNCIFQLTPGNNWKSLCSVDSFELAKAITRAPARDSVLKVINNAIQAGTLIGKMFQEAHW